MTEYHPAIQPAVDDRVFELWGEPISTFDHPAANEPIERLATRIYYSLDATDTERHLADRILSMLDEADEMPGLASDLVPCEEDIADMKTESARVQHELDTCQKRSGADRAVLSEMRYLIDTARRKRRKTLKLQDLEAVLGIAP